MANLKQYLFMLLIILVVALTACSTQEVSNDSELLLGSQEIPTTDSSLDVVTELICLEEQGHVVYSAGDYGCEDGETIVGVIEEFESPAICCRADI